MDRDSTLQRYTFSAAIRRGLIEAQQRGESMAQKLEVFRGDSPRPH